MRARSRIAVSASKHAQAPHVYPTLHTPPLGHSGPLKVQQGLGVWGAIKTAPIGFSIINMKLHKINFPVKS